MKTANLTLVKRNAASVLLTTSFIILITAATEVMSTPLTIGAAIQESVTPTWMNPASRCDSPLEGTITGTGRSSFGNVSVEASDCITPTQNSFVFNHGEMRISFLSGEWIGEEIFVDYDGEFTPTSVPSIFKFTGADFHITGGTGDFLNATGGGQIFGGEDILTGTGLVFMTGKIFNFKNNDDDENDKDRKKKDKGDKESDRDDRKENSDGKEKDEDRAEKRKADRRIAGGADSLALTGGSNNTIMTTGLDSALFPNRQSAGQTIGEFFYLDKSPPQLLAINALPEVGSLSLLGIGLASLMVIRRRKPANSTH